MVKHLSKRGDTLIEVMLAVGIFSMVAVAVVAVMSGGTSSAQTALEATLAREEIDAQAESLRFIQNSYIEEKGRKEDDAPYQVLWEEIVGKAIADEDVVAQVASNYSAVDCATLYNNNLGDGHIGEARNYGFVVNTQALGSGDAIVLGNKDTDKFRSASTYPRLIYQDDGLVTEGGAQPLDAVEGIYIIAVKDPGGSDDIASAYYDFYIRTCWYGSGDETPSTISTLIRLYDPDVVGD